jgi:biopolymer transport protein ExbB
MKDRAVKFVWIVFCAIMSVGIARQSSWFSRGGPIIVPILFCSLLGLGLVLAKAAQLVEFSVDPDAVLNGIFDQMERQRVRPAIDALDQKSVPLTRVLKAGLLKHDRSKDEVREAMDHAFRVEAPLLEGGLGYLMTIIQVLPLLGFIGALLGLMEVIRIMEAKAAVSSAVVMSDLVGAWWQILIASAAALLVAVPLMVGRDILAARVRALVDSIESAADDLVDFFMETKEAV